MCILCISCTTTRSVSSVEIMNKSVIEGFGHKKNMYLIKENGK